MLYDLCIVGAGLFGSAAARHASANPSLNVILIGPEEPTESEKREREIFSSHYDKGRITRELDNHIACQVLGKHTIERYRELEKLSGISFYNPVGLLYIGMKTCPNIELMKQACLLGNVPYVELSESSVKNRYPFMRLRQQEVALLHEKGSGYINPSDMVCAQQKVALIQGCQILHEIVEEVKPLNTQSDIFYHEVITEKSVIRAKRVLICSGAFTNFKKLIPHPRNVIPDIMVSQESAVLVQVSNEDVKRLSSMPTYLYYTKEGLPQGYIGAYGLPPIKYSDNNYYIKIGHLDECGNQLMTLKEVKDWYLSSGDRTITESYSNMLQRMLPDLNIANVKVLTCVTCKSPSHLPYVDRVSPTLSVAIVGNAKGAKLSDEVGRIAAKLAVYGKWDSELPREMFNIIWKENM